MPLTRQEEHEAALRRPCVTKIRLALPEAIAIRHEDVRNSGTPDLTVTALGMTSWWEFKFGDPFFKSKGIQEFVCGQLAREGFCRYVVYRLNEDGTQETLIVHPQAMKERHVYGLVAEERAPGFDHDFVAGYVVRIHEGTRICSAPR